MTSSVLGLKTEDVVKEGFKKVVTSALRPFMERTEVGQHKEEKYFIYVMHNAVIRLDVILWRWNFTSKGFSNIYESALGYLVCTSVVDVTALKTSEFVFLISGYAGDEEEKVVKYTQRMEKIYDAARRVKLNKALRESQDD
ncbi:hypothetical protein CEP52_013562 [Fusarium oligoseptatum]|uniref:Uncharacterized protein n=1 Tax=Fusarium oligoseptatum TaxID=2604345 RepID=A0A428SSZ6_9HYPO|nr:hypothetical protein CEP52_013562 [Fusarium oligoseptatum]